MAVSILLCKFACGMRVVYEDNHIIIVYKESGEIVQGDKTGDTPLSETVKEYIKDWWSLPVPLKH